METLTGLKISSERNGPLAPISVAVSIVSISLVCDLALWPPVLQFQLPALLFVCVLFVLFLLFVLVLSGEPRQKQGRGLFDRKLVQAPQQFYCWLFHGGPSVLAL